MFIVKCIILLSLIITSAESLKAQSKLDIKNDLIAAFEGELKTGQRYIAPIETGEKNLSFQPLTRLKLPMHHAGAIEWTNLEELGMYYPLSESRKTEFIFEVVSKNVASRASGSWTTTYFCRILEIRLDNKYLGAQTYKVFVFTGKCRDVFPTGKRHQSYVFNFKILHILANEENITGSRNAAFKNAVDLRELTFERFAGLGGSYLLAKVSKSGTDPEDFKLDTDKEIEVSLIFSVDE